MKFNKKNDNHRDRGFSSHQSNISQEIPIQEISKKHLGRTFTITGLVDAVVQTTGPTLFTIADGTGSFVVKAFDGAGVRAFPNIEMGHAVSVLMELREFNNALEGEVMRITKLDDKKTLEIQDRIEKAYDKKATPLDTPFMVKSPILEKLRPSMLKAAKEIRLAIFKNRPIIIRHHNDADGYSSGYSLERAILPLVKAQHGTDKQSRQYCSRAPSNTPFYEIEDSIKDTANSLSDLVRFSEKIPLILIVDTGSSIDSLLAIQQGKIHGIDFIVVDHHFFGEDLISKEVMTHINPFLVGEDGSKFSAGMLCCELARLINPVDNIEHIPAMAGLADMIDNPEVMKPYLELAKKKGYSKEQLADTAAVIDYVSTKLRFMEAREYVEVMFGEDINHQKALVSLLAPTIRLMEKKNLEIAKALVQEEKHGKVHLNILDIEKAYSRGTYPKPGRSNGLLHDHFIHKGKTPLVSAGVLSDAITMRATADSKFSTHDLIDHLNKKVPNAFIEGGGHELAGALKFVPFKREEVLDALREYLSKIK